MLSGPLIWPPAQECSLILRTIGLQYRHKVCWSLFPCEDKACRQDHQVGSLETSLQAGPPGVRVGLPGPAEVAWSTAGQGCRTLSSPPVAFPSTLDVTVPRISPSEQKSADRQLESGSVSGVLSELVWSPRASLGLLPRPLFLAKTIPVVLPPVRLGALQTFSSIIQTLTVSGAERLEVPQEDLQSYRQNSTSEAPGERPYSLKIRNTTSCSSGTYRCTLEDPEGQRNLSGTVILKVTEMLLNPSSDSLVTRWYMISLTTCMTTGEPAATCAGLEGGRDALPTSALPLLPSLQSRSFSGTRGGESVSPEVPALMAWRCRQDGCLQKGYDVSCPRQNFP
ncbi:hypothetical protein CB1_000610013 [Camelus ferus]|nr:hypothetical protein CB1_000610013 [Camelus ferus]